MAKYPRTLFVCLLAIGGITQAFGATEIPPWAKNSIVSVGTHHTPIKDDKEINNFLAEYYAAEDAGRTEFVTEHFDENVFVEIVLSKNIKPTNRVMESRGLTEYVRALEQWYSHRGDVASPTTYEVVRYEHPMLFVQGEGTVSGHGSYHFFQNFLFLGDKVMFVGMRVQRNAFNQQLDSKQIQFVTEYMDAIKNKSLEFNEKHLTDDAEFCMAKHFQDEQILTAMFKGKDSILESQKHWFAMIGDINITWDVELAGEDLVMIRGTLMHLESNIAETFVKGLDFDAETGTLDMVGLISTLNIPFENYPAENHYIIV